MSKFEIGDVLYCIKEYETLQVGSQYNITGCGDLTISSDKKGYGFNVEDDRYGSFSGKIDWWKLPHDKRTKFYFFTEDEMSEYFITAEEYYKAYYRNEKLNSLGI